MKPPTIEPMAIARLRPFPGNARTHSKKQVRQIADSIARFGFINPILIDDEDKIIAGHGRLAAAKLLGLKRVPTLRLSGLDPAERRAYALADNKLALNAGWDRAALAAELRALADLQFDAEVTGFSCAEIELVLDDRAARPPPPGGGRACPGLDPGSARASGPGGGDSPSAYAASPSCAAPLPPHPGSPTAIRPSPSRGGCPNAPVLASGGANSEPAAVTRRDDMWRLERHRILCIDPRDLTPIDRMRDAERLVFVAFEPALCDGIVHYFRQLTGQDATLAASGQSFADVAAQRKQESLR
jgi:ParB-like nuclease domain